jgi:acetyl esterase/lipase
MTAPVDIDKLLDPEIAAALAALDLGFAALSDDTLPAVRQAMASAPPPTLSDAVSRSDHVVPGDKPLALRVHREINAAAALPCIYWMHGGGLVLGSHVADDLRFDRWCPELHCVGVSVDYALAPEACYPAPLDDCYAGLRWVHDNAAQLGIDPQRIGIGGASAGAGLAAALALLARDRGELAIAFQALIYPMLDDRQITVSSQWPDPVWPPQANRYGWDSYLGGLADDAVPSYAAPARADDLAALPPTFISVGALDGFSDEDIIYATRLRHAGVPTELHVYPGAPHGYDSLTPNTAIARQARRDLSEWLRKRFDVL